MDLRIRGKLALVTASSGGMGKNIAHALAAESADVVLFARTADKLQAVAQEIESQHGVKALAVAGSMLDAIDVTVYMKGLANELGRKGVTVNCVAPALIDTSHRAGSSVYTAAQTEHRTKLAPLGRLGTQEKMYGVVAFLASAQAGFVTGSTIAVEGGMVASLF